MEDAESFGLWLARQLRRRGMNQAELAAELEVTRAAVSAWVTGRAEPRLDKIQAIEKILALSAGSVFSREDGLDPADDLFWYHRRGHVDGGRELGNAAAFAFDADLSVLAREATQNSLDERHDLGYLMKSATRSMRSPANVSIVSSERFAGMRSSPISRPRRIPGRRSAEYSPMYRETFARPGVPAAPDRDYNARGLTGNDYEDGRFAAVVRRQLDSYKRGTAGGSYGLGKATLWATSRLGLVLINSTLSEPYGGRSERRLVGRLDLPWRASAARTTRGLLGSAYRIHSTTGRRGPGGRTNARSTTSSSGGRATTRARRS